MRKITLLFMKVMLLIVFSVSSAYSQEWLQEYMNETGKGSGNLNYYDVKSWATRHFAEVEEELHEKQKGGKMVLEGEDEEAEQYIHYKRWEWYWSTRIHQDGSLGYPTGKSSSKTNSSNLRLAAGTPTWKSIGYTSNTGAYWGMGKADCIGFHPTNGNIFYVGSNGGGVWKTTDGGLTYTAIGDFLPITQVGSIIVDATNANILYIALGPKQGDHSMGVYKSIDGGTTWKPTALSDDYDAGVGINKMIASPTNSSVLLVGTKHGIYRTADGGASFQKVTDWNANDLVWKPGSATRVYAARDDYWGNSEIYYSDDAGATWNQLTSIGRQKIYLQLAVTPINPSLVAYSMNDGSVEPNVKSLYVSKSNGSAGSFAFKSYLPQTDMHIVVSGLNENIMYHGGVNISKSNDGGLSWTQVTNWENYPGYAIIHADVRNTYLGRTDAGLVYFCNDGGIERYDERNNIWKELSNGLQITQYYSIATAQTDPVIISGGSQDNGGSRKQADGTWIHTNGGDAMIQAIDPTDANIMYTEYVGGEMYRSIDGGIGLSYLANNFPGGKPHGAWATPFVLDPNTPSTIVAGYDNVYISTDKGDTWTRKSNGMTNSGTLDAIAVAPSDSRVIYCSGDQLQPDSSWINKFYRTTNLGLTWDIYKLPTTEKITQIAVHPTNSSVVWVTVAGWVNGHKVFTSIDGGQTWTSYSDGLPNVPTNTIVFQKGSTNDALYVGNDIGVYYRDKTMSRWETYSSGLPNTVVTDLEIQYSAKLLRAATYGRGAWEAPLITSAAQVEDCNGVAGGSARIDGCGVCSGGNTGIVANESCCNPGALIAVEKWTNIEGTSISEIPLTTTPQQTIYINSLDQNFIGEDNFGIRIKGYICPPETGNYTFWIASDDASQLWLSTNDQPGTKSLIAYEDGVSGVRNYDAHPSQKSVSKSLTKGQYYYFEILYKEGGWDAYMTVAWAYNSQPRTVIKPVYIVQGAVNTPPSVTLTSPANNASFTAPASITLSANASDANGSIAKVEFFNGTTLIGQSPSTSSPYTYSWTNVPVGPYSITAKATDNLGATTTTAPVSITVGGVTNKAPAITLTSPANNATYTAPATIALSANATDSDGTIAKVEFYRGTTLIGQSPSTTSPYTFSWTNAVAGVYSITAKATDNAGATTTTAAITVTVTGTNAAPTISITSPANNATFTAPATVALSANASDSDGSISKVEFYSGTTLIGQSPSTSSPYTFSWTNVVAGGYTITAKAYDNSGNVTTSSGVAITVSAASTCVLDEAAPVASLYVVRNSWNDQNAGSSVITESGALKVTHRAYGQSELYVIETGKTFAVTNGQAYTFKFDFKDYTIPVTGLDIGFAVGLNSSNSGPNLVQPLVAAPSGYSSSSFTTKTVSITSAYTGNVSIVFRLRWASQPTGQVTDYIKNISVCKTSTSSKLSEMSAPSLIISPNPSKEEFTLRTEKAIELLFITDSQGRQIYTTTQVMEGTNLEFGRDFNFGIYNISVKYTDGTSETLKILKTR